jgi:hypothetical protein
VSLYWTDIGDGKGIGVFTDVQATKGRTLEVSPVMQAGA